MKVLVVRLSSIGDIILTTPVVRCLKTQLDFEVHYLTKKSFAGILKSNPYLDGILDYESVSEDDLSSFDLVIDLHHNLRTKRLLTPCKNVFKVNKENWKKWQMVNFKTPYALKHIVDRYIDTFPPLQNDGKGLDYFISPNTKLPDSLKRKFDIAIAIGGQHQTKRFPNAKWQELLEELPPNASVVIVGGPAEANDAEIIASKSNSTTLVNAAGKTSLDQTALLISGSSCLITNDTATLHIGSAMDVPTFSLWGNTVPEFGMTSYFAKESKSTALSKEWVSRTACQPCSKIGYEGCPLGHFNCMNSISTKVIAEKIHQLLV